MKVCEKQQVTAIMGFNDDFLPKNGNFNVGCREIFRSKILEIGKRGVVSILTNLRVNPRWEIKVK